MIESFLPVFFPAAASRGREIVEDVVKAVIAEPGRVHRAHAKRLVEVFLEKGTQTSVLVIGRQAARGIGKSHDTRQEHEDNLFHSLPILADYLTIATVLAGEIRRLHGDVFLI